MADRRESAKAALIEFIDELTEQRDEIDQQIAVTRKYLGIINEPQEIHGHPEQRADRVAAKKYAKENITYVPKKVCDRCGQPGTFSDKRWKTCDSCRAKLSKPKPDLEIPAPRPVRKPDDVLY